MNIDIQHFKVIILSILIIVLSLNGYSQRSNMSYSQRINAENDSINLHYKFLTAASDGDIKAVNKFIKDGIYLDFRDDNGGTALFYASNEENVEIVKTLLYYGANPNIKNIDGITALLNVSCYSFPISELLLLTPKTKLNLSDRYSTTAMHYAAYYGQYDIVDMLLFYGADASKKTAFKNSTTYLAAFSGNIGIMELLINNGQSPFEENKEGLSALSVSIVNNDSLLFDYLRAQDGYKEYVIKEKSSLINYATENSNTYALSFLVEIEAVDQTTEDLKSIYRSAYLNRNKNAIKMLKANNLLKFYSPITQSMWLSFSTAFTSGDYCSYFGLGVYDARFGMDIGFKFGTRFKYKSFLDPIDENSFYQHWERRNTYALSINKIFYLYESPMYKIISFAGIDAQFQWADYRGRTLKVKGEFSIVPEVGVGVQLNGLDFNIAYQYTDMGLYDVSPHRIKLGIKARILSMNQPKTYYPLWM